MEDLIATLEANRMLFVPPKKAKKAAVKRTAPWKGTHRDLPNSVSKEMLGAVKAFVESRGVAAQARRHDESGRAGFFIREVFNLCISMYVLWPSSGARVFAERSHAARADSSL